MIWQPTKVLHLYTNRWIVCRSSLTETMRVCCSWFSNPNVRETDWYCRYSNGPSTRSLSSPPQGRNMIVARRHGANRITVQTPITVHLVIIMVNYTDIMGPNACAHEYPQWMAADAFTNTITTRLATGCE
eukprot:57136_1